MVSENEFFREVTLRICGSLDIGEALHACHQYISQHIPVDNLYLERHTDDLSGIEIVAEASADRGLKTGVVIQLPGEYREMLVEAEKQIRADEFFPLEVINRPKEHALGMFILNAIGAPVSSYMGLPLVIGGKLVGGFGALAEGNDRFNEHHQRLFATLKEPLFVAMSNVIKHQELLRLKDRLADDNRQLQRELLHISGDQFIGADFGLREVMHQVQHVAATDTPVLLTGETGSGKDVVANSIHLTSPRCNGPFIPVNCGAIPDSLIDSELFGHEKGAFTGALATKRGRFERANGGTILLDEIGEMPMEAQVRLLRVLQNREIERVGGTERIPVDIRIIAATHRDLSQLVREKRFREDLLFRLNVFPIHVPPLREHPGDIPALVQFFMERKTLELKRREKPRLAQGAIDRLMSYDWPGNVRELENVLERAMIIAEPFEPLRFDDLGLSPAPTAASSDAADSRSLNLDAAVAGHIRNVLALADGKIHGSGGAGELLGVNPNTLRSRMRKYGIPFQKQKRGGHG